MRTEQRLKQEAREGCKFRGHRMSRHWEGLHYKRQSIKCKDCGMHVIIDLDPAPNGIDICGQAVALHCPESE